MAAGDISIRFAAEGDQTLKSAIQAIDNQIKALNEGVKASTEAMKGMGSQEEATAQKNELLARSIEANKQKMELLSRQYDEAKDKLAKLGQELEAAKRANDPTAVEKATRAYNQQSSEVSKLEGAMSKAQGEINKAENAIEGLGNEMEDTAKSTTVLSDGFTVVKGVVTNLITDAIEKLVSSLKNAAKYMMDAGMSFESTMSKVQAVSGASADEMARLSDKAQEMGAKTKFSASEAGEAFNYMAMAGWKTEDMLDGIEGVMNLAAASGADLAAASDIVTDALTAMGYGAQDAAKLADVMAAASSSANTNVEMMGETFKYAAPLIGTLGYKMEDAAVAIALMADAGTKGSQAGTALRSTLTNLAAPSKDAAMAMEKYGISLTDSQGKMKPFSQVMEELRQKFKTMTETEQANVASTIAGKNAMSGFLAIVNSSDEKFNEFTQAINNSSGAAQDMANVMQNNLAGSIGLLKSAAEGVAISLYNGFSGTAKTAVDGLTEAVGRANDKITEWVQSEKAQEMLKRMADAAQTLVNKLLNNLEPALNAVVGAIEGIVRIATSVISNWDKIAAAVQTAVKAFIAVKAAMAALQFASLAASITPVGAAITALIATITLLITNWDRVKAAAQATWNDIKNAWSGAANWFKSIVSGITNAFAGIGDKISKLFSDGWNKIKNAWSGATNHFKSVADGIKNAFSNIGSNISSYFSDAWNKAKNAWSGAKSHFSSVATDIKNALSNTLSNLGSTARNWAKDMMTGFGNGIRSFMSSVTQPVQDLASKIASFLHFTKPDEGPLREYEEWMPHFVKGLAKGLTRSAPILGEAAEGLAGTLAGGASNMTLGAAAAEGTAMQPIFLQVDGQTFARLMTGYIDKQQGENWTTSMALGLA